MARTFKQGFFKPKNPSKYKGSCKKIIYRSSYELKFMLWCDNHPDVIYWNSEGVIIPYVSPKDEELHRYFVDFLVKIKSIHNEEKVYLIEIKPYVQTIPPKQTKNRKRMIQETVTYEVNQAKWKAAKRWCDDRKIEFKIMTEKELNIR